MNKLTTFFNSLYLSLTNLDYYRDVIKADLRFSLKYYFALCIVLASSISILSSYRNYETFKTQASNFLENGLFLFPEDLEITVIQGVSSINQEEPYFIELPELVKSQEENSYAYLVVIDSDGTLDDLEKYKTTMVLNEKNLLVKVAGETQVYPLINFPDFKLTKAEFDDSMRVMQKLVYLVPVLLFLISFTVLSIYYFVIRLVYVIAGGILLAIIGKSRGLNYKIDKYYQLSIHSSTLPLILESLTIMLALQLPIPFWFFVLHLILGTIIIFHLADNNK